MTTEDIKVAIKSTLEDIGIYVAENEIVGQESDFDFSEYFADSLQYITFIVALEAKLNVQIPDELLLMDNFKSINAFASMVENIIDDKGLIR